MNQPAGSVGAQLRPSAGRHRGVLRPRRAGPSDEVLHRLAGWYAIALRLGGAVLFTAVAVLAAKRQVSGWWLGAPLTALCLWSALFAWQVRRSGLTPIVVLADAAVISALELAQQHLVPAALIMDDTTWMLPLACTSVYILQIALRPWLGLPGAAMVIVAYGLGAGHPLDGWLLVVETLVAAGLVAVIRGGARQADAIVASGLETERQIRAEEARRADEREQHRQLHDTILSTLTMPCWPGPPSPRWPSPPGSGRWMPPVSPSIGNADGALSPRSDDAERCPAIQPGVGLRPICLAGSSRRGNSGRAASARTPAVGGPASRMNCLIRPFAEVSRLPGTCGRR